MNNRTKKCLLITACLALCAVMVVLITNRFEREDITDDPITVADIPVSDITINAVAEPSVANDPIPVVVKPEIPMPTEYTSGNNAVYTGTEQTIQPDIVKPEYDEETLMDPTKTPDGEKLDEPPQHVDHEEVITPTPEGIHSGSGGSGNNGGNSGSSNNGGGNSKSGSSGGLPGFDNVPNAGENKGTHLDGGGDINKQVGVMG